MGCIDGSCLNIRLQTWCEVVETRKKDHVLYKSIDIKCLEKVNLEEESRWAIAWGWEWGTGPDCKQALWFC